jgi:chromosome transmission fidelity protein 18
VYGFNSESFFFQSINRTLLSWIKLWDYVVFGKDKPVKKTAKIQVKPNADGKKEFVRRDFRKEQMAMEEELDSLNRPKHKVVMLCGPPGLGKTTLAHVIAQHAGYNVVEINAR